MNVQFDSTQKILLFDGVCNLCNASVQYVIRHDKNDSIKFASLQSNFGQSIMKTNGFNESSLKTVIYLRHGNVEIRSNAFLYIMKDLGGWHQIFRIFWIVPRFLRDAIYNVIATSRYSIFGKKNECYVPTADLESRFIND